MKISDVLSWGRKDDNLSVNIKSALHEVSAAVMMVNRDFVVTYANKATEKLFSDHAEVFKTAFPHFNSSQIIGTNIDVFHRNPAHQRKLLADPNNLPLFTDIKLDTLTINLFVTATYDAKGCYSGNVLEWCDVTAERLRAKTDLDNAGKLTAIEKSQGSIELDLDGKVITANQIFLDVLGYTLEETQSQHHSAFVTPEYANSQEYKDFWATLNRGEYVSGRFKRIGKQGKNIWLQASYNPIIDEHGKPYKVVKYATDISAQVLMEEQAKTLSLVANETDNSVIITDAHGLIEYVNPGFTKLTGIPFDNAIGKKPGQLLQGKYTDPETKKRIRDKLEAKKPFYEEILNYTKQGEPYWISLAINPVFDAKGVLQKFVSIQTNINETKLRTLEFLAKLEAISKVSGTTEFTADGIITDANENFCQVVGYRLDEIKGKHHRIFIDDAQKNSADYKAFWESLNRNEPQVGQFKRIDKHGKERWLEASYNPIVNEEGKVIKVVQFATDITAQYQSTRALEAAVEESKQVIELAKSGDLSKRVPIEGKSGAIASLCDGLNTLIDSMSEFLLNIREAGETIHTAANEISSGNNDLSSRTEEQASSLEQTASSMEELASAVKQNADSAKQANQMAEVASQVAIRGGEVVCDVVNTMSAINASARKIEDIITVIDGIAFQTNILALNAAVEAARAGEQGRGFAVVAGEVRNLAQRSASAAKEIKALISESVSKAEGGVKLVENAGATMQEIVSSVKRVTDIMGEITAASQEQSNGIDQVNVAINSMDEVTQQNAALVEQAAAAAESLVEQASSLMDSVNHYQLLATSVNNREQKAVKKNRSHVAASQLDRSNGAKKIAKSVMAGQKTGTDDTDWGAF